jgi:hypothetical protein
MSTVCSGSCIYTYDAVHMEWTLEESCSGGCTCSDLGAQDYADLTPYLKTNTATKRTYKIPLPIFNAALLARKVTFPIKAGVSVHPISKGKITITKATPATGVTMAPTDGDTFEVLCD